MLPSAYRSLLRSIPLISFMSSSRRRSSLMNTALGGAWNILNPLAQLGIYWFLIEVIFQRSEGYPTNPALFIIVGIAHYMFFQRALVLGAGSIHKNDRLLLQVRLEPLIFVGVSFREAIGDLLIALGLCVGFFILLAPPAWGFPLLAYPVLLLGLAVLTWSWAVILATLSVFSRDLPNTLAIVLRLLLYATPVVYPATMVPERIRTVIDLNPLSGWFAMMHWSLFGADPPSIAAVVVFVVVTLGSLMVSHVLYTRFEPRFTKVL